MDSETIKNKMSQFGTIGTLFPSCTSHPSCSQFNARDIIFRYEMNQNIGGNPLESKFSMDVKTSNLNRIDQENGSISPTPKNIKRGWKNIMRNTGSNEEMTKTEEVTRRYVEVTPGVWSFMN